MSTWAMLITKPEMVGGRAVSSDSGAPGVDVGEFQRHFHGGGTVVGEKNFF